MTRWLSHQILWLLSALLAILLAGAALLPFAAGNIVNFERIRTDGERLQFYGARLGVAVVGLRHGLSNNYDEANHWVASMAEAESDLAAIAGSDADLRLLWLRYSAASKESMEGWERFKLTNSLVRNSLRNFLSGVHDFTPSLPNSVAMQSLREDMARLSNAMLIEALGEGRGTESGLAELESKLEHYDRAIPSASLPEFKRLLSHARVVERYSAGLARSTELLVNGESQRQLVEMLALNQRKVSAEQAAMTRYRIGLLVGVMVLLSALTVLLFTHMVERRKRDREIRLAATVFNSSQQGIVFTNVSGEIVSVNQAFCDMTGYDAQELVGKNPRFLRSGAHNQEFYAALWTAIKTDGRWRGEITNRRKNGDLYVQWTTIESVQTIQGENLYVGIASDVTEVIEARNRLTQLAYYDTLTGLPNRQLFFDRLEQSVAVCRRDHSPLALIYADLDNFKTINDTLGHSAGDHLLIEVAKRLRDCVRETDTVARLGGDEFALILGKARGPQEMARIAELVLKRIAETCDIQGVEVTTGVSLGIALWPDDGDNSEALMKSADVAMYRAKSLGRSKYQFFTPEMAVAAANTLRIESGLRHALLNSELAMHYQPQFSSDGTVIGVEALMRWRSPNLGNVPPGIFIPVAERSGLISQLGDFALVEAVRQCVAWRETLSPDLRVSINVSGAQFRHDGLVERVHSVLQSNCMPSSALELEVTESVVMEDVSKGQNILSALKNLGCRLAIDDFGTGYSYPSGEGPVSYRLLLS